MKKVEVKEANRITINNIQRYMERTVTKFGSGAKVDCPKEFLRKKEILIIKKRGLATYVPMSTQSDRII